MERFLAKQSAELGRKIPVLSDQEWETREAYDWPGNIRELENLARKIVVLARAASRQAERDLILKALERTHWNRKRATRDL